MNLKELLKETEDLIRLIEITKDAYGLKKQLKGIKQTVEAVDFSVKNRFILLGEMGGKSGYNKNLLENEIQEWQNLKKLLGIK